MAAPADGARATVSVAVPPPCPQARAEAAAAVCCCLLGLRANRLTHRPPPTLLHARRGSERGGYVQVNAKSKRGEGWGADLASKMSGEGGGGGGGGGAGWWATERQRNGGGLVPARSADPPYASAARTQCGCGPTQQTRTTWRAPTCCAGGWTTPWRRRSGTRPCDAIIHTVMLSSASRPTHAPLRVRMNSSCCLLPVLHRCSPKPHCRSPARCRHLPARPL